MSAPANPADMRAYILERLVGDTGEPDRLVEAARSLAGRALPAIVQNLNADLAVPLEVEVGRIEIARLQAAKPAEASFDAMTVVSSIASPDALVLTLEADALALIVGALFGADLDMAPTPIERELSPTEAEIASMVFGGFAQALNGSGARGLGLKLPPPAALTGQDRQKHALRDGPAVRIAFRVFSPVASGNLFVTMPQRLLMKPRGEGGAANERDMARQPDWTARFGEEVMRSAVRLDATIPMGRMTLGDLAGLSVGQLIEMPKTASGETRLAARGKTIFLCEFGKLGEQYTVRVRQPFDAGQDFIDGLVSG